MWQISLKGIDVELFKTGLIRKTLAVDSASLSLNYKPKSRKFPYFGNSSAAILHDDDASSNIINSGVLDDVQIVHFTGKGRYFSTRSEMEVHQRSALIAKSIVDILSFRHKTYLENSDLLRHFYSIEFRNPLRIFCEILYIVKKYDISAIRVPTVSISGAFVLLKMLNEDLPAIQLSKSMHFNLGDVFNDARRHQGDIRILKRGNIGVVTSIYGYSEKDNNSLNNIRHFLEKEGISEISLRDPTRVSIHKFNPISVYKFYRLFTACGFPSLLAYRFSLSFLYSHNIRLPNMIQFLNAGLIYRQQNPDKKILILDTFRHPGVFFGYGALTHKRKLIGINRHNQLEGTLNQKPLFEKILDASGNIRNPSSAIQSVKIFTKESNITKADKGTVLVSQPLSEEMHVLQQYIMIQGGASFTLHLHPNDGPASIARWRRVFSDRNIQYSSGIDVPPAREFLGFSSTLLLQAAIYGVPVIHVAEEDNLKLVWRRPEHRPGIAQTITKIKNDENTSKEIDSILHNYDYIARYTEIPSIKEFLL
jgi:hypothetical protein